MPRKLASWTDAFFQYTEKMGTPPLFRRWCGIFTVAAALERKVWTRTNKGPLFPNLYIFLIGPPGAGKTVALDKAAEFFTKLEGHHLAPTSLSRASMIDQLEMAKRTPVNPLASPPVTTFHSLTIMANELGTLLPTYEGDFMNVLTDIYDCKRYSEKKRTNKIDILIPAPQINLAAATTPSYMNGFLPEGAWDQGFLSRTILIYSSGVEMYDLWEMHELDTRMKEALEFDLKEIGAMQGEFDIEQDVKEAFTAWQRGGRQPAPDHPKLAHYNSRRAAHLLKLSTIACASVGDTKIKLEHYAEAMDWLLEAEHAMPDIFRSMTMGPTSAVMRDLWYHAWGITTKEKRPVAEHRLVTFLAERVPAHDVARVLEVMVKMKIFSTEFVSGAGICYAVQPLKKLD